MKINLQKGITQKIIFTLLLVFIISWTILLYFHPPEELVSVIGVNNSYLVGFLISVIGALSSFTTVSTYPAIITLATGDINPFILGISAGLGLAIGDIMFFYFGYTARGVVSKKIKERLEKILNWLAKKSDRYIQVFIFIYVGFTPFPNNVLTGLLAIIGYPLKKVGPPLVAGDIVLPTLAAWLAFKEIDLGIF